MKKSVLLVILVIISGFVGGVLSNVLFMTGTTFAQVKETPEKVISAQEIRLVDASGKTRAAFTLGTYGNASLNLYDQDNKSRVMLGLSAKGEPSLKLSNGGVVELRDSKDKVRSKIMMLSDVSPSLRLYDETGSNRAILGSINLETPETTKAGNLEKRPESSLVFVDKAGKPLWSAP